MAQNPFFVEFASDAIRKGNCEVGMHLHAWCSPPDYQLPQNTKHRSYLIEYPLNIMEEKIKRLDDLLGETFGQKAFSHRSGRWALNQDYIDLLSKYGYICDCSVTPGVNWASSLGTTGIPGSDFSRSPAQPHMLTDSMMEVPVTIRNLHYFDAERVRSPKTLAKEAYHLIRGKQSWLRPSIASLGRMKQLVKTASLKSDYVMFMIHSSELMPGGSPYYKDENAIEHLYDVLEELFEYLSASFQGITLEQYTKQKMSIKQK